MEKNKLFECVIQGEVTSPNMTDFLQRLKGLCNGGTIKEKVAYKEYVYIFDQESPTYIAGIPTTELRTRNIIHGSSLHVGQSVETNPESLHRWELRYVGKWDNRSQQAQSTSVTQSRTMLSVSTSNNVEVFLYHMGFRPTYGYMICGSRWQPPNGILIEVFKMKELKVGDDSNNITTIEVENMEVASYLVELKAFTNDNKIEETSQFLKRFSVDLQPFFNPRPSEVKGLLHSTATLAAEARRKSTKRSRP